ncbi:hypothetical protein GKD32_06180, partial [Lactobacillus paracasei]|nr:hypothetical protein [Lacticaseibacillus paracasei]
KPTAVRQYSVDGATGTVQSYTKTLTSELNNTITLKNKTPHSYRYVETNLTTEPIAAPPTLCFLS